MAMQAIFDWRGQRLDFADSTSSRPTIQTSPMSLAASYRNLLFGFWQTPEIWTSTFVRKPANHTNLPASRSIPVILESSSSSLYRLHQLDNRFAFSSDATCGGKLVHYSSPSTIPGPSFHPDNPHETQQATGPLSLDKTKAPSTISIDRAPQRPCLCNGNLSYGKRLGVPQKRTGKDRRTRFPGSDADDEGPISIPRSLIEPGHPFDLISVTWKEEDYIMSGTFGDIYKGQMNGHAVCVKLIRPLQIQGDDVRKLSKAFHLECLTWAQLSHPNVLPFCGCRQDISRPCLITPWMEHGNVNAYLLANPNVNRYQIASDILNGLDFLHSQGIIHGGLKGSNVLIDQTGRARVVDYGISSLVYSTIQGWGANATAVPTGGINRWEAPELFGYDSPEVRVKTAKSDIYAWSCVCYEMFTGKCPFFEIKTDDAVFLRIVLNRATPTRPSNDSDAWQTWGLVEEFWSAMTACWSWTPSSRPTVSELLIKTTRLTLTDNRQLIAGRPPTSACGSIDCHGECFLKHLRILSKRLSWRMSHGSHREPDHLFQPDD